MLGLGELFSSSDGGADPTGVNLTLSRHNTGARMFFHDAKGKPHAIPVHVLTGFQEAQASSITEFPVEDGSSISDHVIHFPTILKVEIGQTQIPFESMEDNGQLVEFSEESIKLTVRKSQYRAKGLLALTVAVGAVVGAAVDAIGSLLGAEPTDDESAAVVQVPPTGVNYIKDLREKLDDVRIKALPVEIQWESQTWTDYYIEGIQYSRAPGLELGRFGLSLKRVKKVKSATAAIPAPLGGGLLGAIGLLPEKSAGTVPAPKLAGSGADAKKKSLLASAADLF